MYKYRIGETCFDGSVYGKLLGVLLRHQLNTTNNVIVAKVVNAILCHINQKRMARLQDIILPLFFILVKLHLEYCFYSRPHTLKKNT